MNKEQKERYLENKICPYCVDGNIDYRGKLQFRENSVIHEVQCVQCRKIWIDIYKLVDIEGK